MSEQFNPVYESAESFEEVAVEHLDPATLPKLQPGEHTVAIKLPRLFVYYAEPEMSAN